MDAEVREAIRSYNPADEVSVIKTLGLLRRVGIDHTSLEVPTCPAAVVPLEHSCVRLEGLIQPFYGCLGYYAWTLVGAILKAANEIPKTPNAYLIIERAWGIQKVSLEDIKPMTDTLRNYSDIEHLERSIAELGVLNAISVNEDLRVINGQARYLISKKLGLETIPCKLFCVRLRSGT